MMRVERRATATPEAEGQCKGRARRVRSRWASIATPRAARTGARPPSASRPRAEARMGWAVQRGGRMALAGAPPTAGGRVRAPRRGQAYRRCPRLARRGNPGCRLWPAPHSAEVPTRLSAPPPTLRQCGDGRRAVASHTSVTHGVHDPVNGRGLSRITVLHMDKRGSERFYLRSVKQSTLQPTD